MRPSSPITGPAASPQQLQGARTTETATHDVTTFSDLGQSMWEYLTGKDAAINYEFVNMVIDVPRETGVDAPSASWKLNGTLRITTSDRDNRR